MESENGIKYTTRGDREDYLDDLAAKARAVRDTPEKFDKEGDLIDGASIPADPEEPEEPEAIEDNLDAAEEETEESLEVEKQEEAQPPTQSRTTSVMVRGHIYHVPTADVEAVGGTAEYQKRAAVHSYREEAAQLEQFGDTDGAQQLRIRADKLSGVLVEKEQPKAEPAVGDDGLTESQRQELTELSETYTEEFVDIKRELYRLKNEKAAPQQPQPTPYQIQRISEDAARKAAEEALQQKEHKDYEAALEIQRLEANAAFTEQFGHIEADPELAEQTMRRFKRLRIDPRNANKTLKHILLEAGRETDVWLQSHRGAGDEKPNVDKDIIERKRKSSGTIPKSAGATKGRTPAPKPKTGHDVVAEMRRSRGLPDY